MGNKYILKIAQFLCSFILFYGGITWLLYCLFFVLLSFLPAPNMTNYDDSVVWALRLLFLSHSFVFLFVLELCSLVGPENQKSIS